MARAELAFLPGTEEWSLERGPRRWRFRGRLFLGAEAPPRRRPRLRLPPDSPELAGWGAREATLELLQLGSLGPVEAVGAGQGLPGELSWRWKKPAPWGEFLLLPLARSLPRSWRLLARGPRRPLYGVRLAAGAAWALVPPTPAQIAFARRAARGAARIDSRGAGC